MPCSQLLDKMNVIIEGSDAWARLLQSEMWVGNDMVLYARTEASSILFLEMGSTNDVRCRR